MSSVEAPSGCAGVLRAVGGEEIGAVLESTMCSATLLVFTVPLMRAEARRDLVDALGGYRKGRQRWRRRAPVA